MKFRSVAGAVVGALVIGLLATPSSSGAIKAGTACKKAGLQIVDSGRKYTCIKQGKKFVWNKGVIVKAVPVTKPTPTATPTASPLPSATPEPSPLGVTHHAFHLADLLDEHVFDVVVGVVLSEAVLLLNTSS